VLFPRANDRPDSPRLLAALRRMAPQLGSRRWQDREVFEHSNKRLNRVPGNLIRLWTQRCARQPTVAGTLVAHTVVFLEEME
jgi:hypothetical protein